MNYATIIVEDSTAVRTITLHRPERRNAMTGEMQDELLTALEDAVLSGCRVLVLTGAGAAFSAGLDLSALRGMQDQSEAVQRTDAERIACLFRTLYELPIPTIAAVNGPAIAGGAGLALLCDFTLAVPEAKFGFTEVRIGFVPALVSAFLALQIGEKRSRDLLFTGRIFDADEAYRLGLLTEVVPHSELMQRVKAITQILAANSPQSIQMTKRLMNEQNKAWLDAAIEAATKANAQARKTADFREGISAFLEKRKPDWKM
ncbi:MAG TPA: enoyl-CoA hydratase-related protein [Terracidiphilus sp.]|nr:enoyl-CoA hydratase-related protein [Terracidiphilus sp.]